MVPDDKAVGRKLADDAMYKLEHEKDDKGKSEDARPRIEHISFIQDRVKDDYLANRFLRYLVMYRTPLFHQFHNVVHRYM